MGFDRGRGSPLFPLGVLCGAGPEAENGSSEVRSKVLDRKNDGVRLPKPFGVLLIARETALTYFLPAL